MSFHSVRMGLIQANHFGNRHFSQRGEYKTPLEDFAGVSRLLSDTVQMIPALTGWIAAYGKKNRNSGSRRMQRCISFYGSSVTSISLPSKSRITKECVPCRSDSIGVTLTPREDN
jgi:hypothetical protein